VTFGALLAGAIKDAGYSSLRTFAIDSGISRQSVQAYVSGERLPANKSLEKILETLGSTPALDERLRFSLAEARTEKDGNDYGIKATEALKPTAENAQARQQAEQVLDVFFEHGNRDRTPELELFLRGEFMKILNDN